MHLDITKIFPKAVTDVQRFLTNHEPKELAIRVALAAVILLSFSEGYLFNTLLITTFSIPGAVIAAGALCGAYGYSALKAGLIAREIFQVTFGALLLCSSWQLLNQYENWGLPSVYSVYRGEKFQGLLETTSNTPWIQQMAKCLKQPKRFPWF